MFCMLYKWLISRSMDADKSLPRLVVKHLRKCPACNSFYENCLELAAQLPELAKDERAEVSNELHARIMRGLEGNKAKVRTAIRPGWRVLVPATAAAVVALAILLTIQNYRGPDQRPEPGSTAGVINTETIGWLIELNAEKAVSIEEAVQGPLQEEIRLLGDEGKAAAEFLLACIPLDMNVLMKNDKP